MATKKTTEDFKKQIAEKFHLKDSDFLVLSEYTGWDGPIIIQCLRCGKVSKKKANSWLSNKKRLFCQCDNYTPIFFQKLDNFDKWRKEQTNFLFLDEPNGTLENIRVKCLYCGAEQKRSLDSLCKNTGCQVCGTKQGIKKTAAQFATELLEKYGGEYAPMEDYKGANVPILIKHNVCGKIYTTKPHHILTDKGGKCPICGKKSKGERKIRLFLQQHNVLFEEQKRFDNFKRYPYDFWLPEYNLLIEFQGKQHYEPVEHFGGIESFIHQQEIDNKKRLFANQNGIELFTIRYTLLPQIDYLLTQRLSLGSSENETIVVSNETKI